MNKVSQTMTVSAMACLAWTATGHAATAMTVDPTLPTAVSLPHMPMARQVPQSAISTPNSTAEYATWVRPADYTAITAPVAVSPDRCIIMVVPV
ncbi:hypothetical protein OG900_23330 [Streptomyces sp. NBC_00433]